MTAKLEIRVGLFLQGLLGGSWRLHGLLPQCDETGEWMDDWDLWKHERRHPTQSGWSGIS